MPPDTWYGDQEPDPVSIGVMGWIRVARRGVALGLLVFGGLILLLLLRLVERPIFGLHRPVTPRITQCVCRNAFRILGIGLRVTGTPMTAPGAVVANHSSWLDIFCLNALMPVYFVSKAEVAKWPGIGWLARATGTMFIERSRSKAREHTDLFEQRLKAGHKLVFFPEGTSTDGLRVIAFKTTPFAAFFTDHLRDEMQIQPVSVTYRAPSGQPPRFYGWWGDMDFGPHLLKILAQRRQGSVELNYLDPVRVADFDGRKALALHLQRLVQDAHEQSASNIPA